MNSKKKKISKKNKSSWRKYINIKDVDDFLEDQRLDERLGFVSTLADNELFQIDTQPSVKSDRPLSEKQKRRQELKERSLKCFSLLVPHTKVPDPINKRNRVKTKEERKNLLIKKKETERISKGILKAKERQAIKDREKFENELKLKPKKGDFLTDIWQNEDSGLGIEKDEWVDNTTKRHTSLTLGSAKKRIGKAPDKQPPAIPSIELPHPGLSYNPSLEDHQNLLREAVEKEQEIIREEKHLERVTKDMLKKVSSNDKQQSWLSEMSQGLVSTDEQEELPSNSENEEYSAVNPPVKNKKKTAKQRRKQKEQLELKKALLESKREKRKIADIYKLKFIEKQIERNEAKMKLLQEKRKKAEEYKKKEAKRLGALKFEEGDVEFTTGEDLSGNLRNLRSKGNLLLDRFKSLQKRSILQPTVRQTQKRAKVKKYTKPDRKDDWKKTVARPSLAASKTKLK